MLKCKGHGLKHYNEILTGNSHMLNLYNEIPTGKGHVLKVLQWNTKIN